MLNSVEDKDSRFINGFRFKEKLLCVSRGQWDISSLKQVFFLVFIIDNEGEIFVVKSTKRFYSKMSVQVPITFPNVRLA